jgi:hypothetical protein
MANRVQDGLSVMRLQVSNVLHSARNNGLAIITSSDRQSKSLNLRRTKTNAQRWYKSFRSFLKEFFAVSEPVSGLLLFKRLIRSILTRENP